MKFIINYYKIQLSILKLFKKNCFVTMIAHEFDKYGQKD